MMSLARSARWAAWFNSWLDGHTPVDDATAAVLADDAAHDVVGFGDDPMSLQQAWLEMRDNGARFASVALPVPGDPVGLAGPPAFNEAAVDAEEAVVVAGAGAGFVPSVVGRGVFWAAHEANAPTTLASAAEAERDLREQLLDTGNELAELDVARWRPELADALSSLRESDDVPLPPGYDRRAQRLSALASRCLQIADLALTDEGGSVTLAESTSRRISIEKLQSAARSGMVAACNSLSPHGGGAPV